MHLQEPKGHAESVGLLAFKGFPGAYITMAFTLALATASRMGDDLPIHLQDVVARIEI